MKENTNEELLDTRIRAHYDKMPPSEKRLANFILSFPGDITGYSATELCELAETSKAAATRFFSRLGYSDFQEARRQAREAKSWGAPVYQATNVSQSQASTSNKDQLIIDHLNHEQVNLQKTLEAIDIAQLQKIVQAIINQKRIRVVGYRNNKFLAEYLHRQLTLLRADVSLHPGANQSIAEEFFAIDEDDLIIVLAMRRRTPIIEKVLSFAQQKKSSVLLISDPTAATLEKYATWQLNCIVHSTSTLDSYSSIMSLLTLLISQCFSQSSNAQTRLSAIESVHEQFGELSKK